MDLDLQWELGSGLENVRYKNRRLTTRMWSAQVVKWQTGDQLQIYPSFPIYLPIKDNTLKTFLN
jgi:hypothetical protein